jgi:antitoxin ParD1/3/4
VREGLRLIEEREARLAALQTMLNTSIAEGGAGGDDELGAFLDAQATELTKAGV